jgi:hypothetical protein
MRIQQLLLLDVVARAVRSNFIVQNTDSEYLEFDHSVAKRFGHDVPAPAACERKNQRATDGAARQLLGIFHAGQVEPRANSIKGNSAIAAESMPVRGTYGGDASYALTRSQSREDWL